jgi:adenosylmethionine-8-amino-7-oxononanoate aminotransferase
MLSFTRAVENLYAMPTAEADLRQSARDHLLLHFARNGAYGVDGNPLLILERGEGPYVFDTEGNRHFDGLSSLFCAQLGYSFGEEIGAEIAAQLSRLAFNSNWGTAHPPAIELAERLAQRTPGSCDHVFFTNGGSEAVESAWKIIRQYHLAHGDDQRTVAIARDIAYHGATLGALAFTGVETIKQPFGVASVEVARAPVTNPYRAPDGGEEAAFCARLLAETAATIEAVGAHRVAMIIAEPVQNAGGCFVPPVGYWEGLRRLADDCGAVLVADEVITGFGRLGEWFGSNRVGAQPDVITVAKGITSAYAPMGAVMVCDHVAAPFYEEGRTLLHGTTFGGHPIACAAALCNIEIFEREGILQNVRENEAYLREGFETLRDEVPIIGDVRGAGFFWGLELVRDESGSRFEAAEREALLRAFLPARLSEEGLIARPDDRGDAVIQFAPPLICGQPDLDVLLAKSRSVLADASDRFYAGN